MFSVEKVKEQAGKYCNELRYGGMAAVSTALMMLPTVTAWATEGESGAASSAGTSLLTGEVWTTITSGFADMSATCTQVVIAATAAGVTVVALSGAAKYAVKKIKGILSQAG